MADILTVLHDIDRMRGKICRNCVSWGPSIWGGGPQCRKRYQPADENDGCDEWQPIQPQSDRSAA